MTDVLIKRELLERIGELMHIIAHRQDDYGVEAEYLDNILSKVLAHPTRQGEAVEVVGIRISTDGFGSYIADSAMGIGAVMPGEVRAPLMTVAQHQRILAASVPAGCKVVPVELLEQIAVELEHDNDRYFLGRELRALLASAEGVKP